LGQQQTAGIYDYLPNSANTAPKEPRKTILDITKAKENFLLVL
jgi:hypothetical protein